MASVNDLVVVTPAIIADARRLDEVYDYWQARMIRWVMFGWPTKSLICGIKWEDYQDELHYGDTLLEWRERYMPGYPEEVSERNLPTYSTGEMSSEAIRERDWYRRQAREQAIIEKHDAGGSLNTSERRVYQLWTDIQNMAPSFVEETPQYLDDMDTVNDQAKVHKGNDCATISTSGCLNDENNAICQSDAGFGASEWVDSPAPSPTSIAEEFPVNDWGMSNCEKTLCSEKISPIQLRVQYDNGTRGKNYNLPPGIGKHIQAPPMSDDSRWSIIGDDTLDNIPAEIPYVFVPCTTQDEEPPSNKKVRGLLMQHGEPESKATLLYGEEVCHKDNSWLVSANPEVTQEMMAQNQEQVARNKNEAVKTLEILAKFGKNLDLLIPVIQMVLKDSKLCQAIYEELVVRDLGFLNRAARKKSLRFHGRVETVLNSLDRWAIADIESAIEDVRLILEDHELVLEILDAVDGGKTQKDRPLIDPDFSRASCVNCGKDLKELAVIYGRDHSTLMASGCRICEDARLKRAHDLLWKWHKNPELIDDEQYKDVFGVGKGFKVPNENEEACVGNFDCTEE